MFLVFTVLNQGDKIKEDEMSRTYSTNEGQEKDFGILVNRPKEKKRLGRPKRGWEGNIKMHIKQAGWAVVKRINLAQNRARGVKNLMNVWIL
jgi:hypothetical protein